MAILKQTTYMADDGKSYSTLSEAQIAQAKHVKAQIALKAINKQKETLHRVFADLSSNPSLNAIIVTDLVVNGVKAIKLRDALNRVVDYHRRKSNKKKN